MSIAIQAPAAGNALRLLITPPAGAVWWRVMRRSSAPPAGPDDPGALVVADRSTDEVLYDTVCVENGPTYQYAAYYWLGSAWAAESDTASAVAASIYQDGGIDPLQVIRQRVDAGIAAEVAAGRLAPADGVVSVHVAPFWLADDFAFPGISVHLTSSSPNAGRCIGNDVFPPVDNGDGTLTEFEGWIVSTQVEVVAVSLNGDERLALRRALARVLEANLLIFEGLGLQDIEVTISDSEDFAAKAAPLFFTSASISCSSASFVTITRPAFQSISASTIF